MIDKISEQQKLVDKLFWDGYIKDAKKYEIYLNKLVEQYDNGELYYVDF